MADNSVYLAMLDKIMAQHTKCLDEQEQRLTGFSACWYCGGLNPEPALKCEHCGGLIYARS